MKKREDFLSDASSSEASAGKEESIDRRNRLDEEPFSYRVTKDGKVLISWQGKQVTVLSGKESERFLGRIAGADAKEAQLAMAKATGNFKRGNERR